jgi:ElaB/YqjD/DUF883 family membrane-anchored ribosome-binding protein
VAKIQPASSSGVAAMSRILLRRLYLLFVFLVCAGWPPPTSAIDLGRCFSGGCDVAWELNRRFDDGLRSKSAGLVGPIKQAYFDIANDLFDTKLRPMINDIDQRAQARIKDVKSLVDDAGKIIDTSLAAAERAAHNTLEQAQAIVKETKAQIDDAIKKIDEEIEKVSCIEGKTVNDVRKLITLDWAIVHFDSCYTDLNYKWSSPDFDNDVDKYLIKKCLIEKDLNGSLTVKRIIENISRLSQLASETECILRKTTGSTLASDDANRYTKDFAVWYLTAK